MLETFRPGVAGIFKHLPPECQQNYGNVGFTVEDEMSVKFGPVINACRECAGPEVMSSSRVCASRELAQSQKGRKSVERYTRATKLFNSQGTTAAIECFGQIHVPGVNYSNF